MRRFGVVCGIGAMVAPIGDHFHVGRGVTEYLTDFGPLWLGNSPLWFVVLCASYLGAVALLGGARSWRPPTAWVLASPLYVLALYLATSFYPLREGGTLEAISYAAALTLHLALDRSTRGFLVAAGVALIATGFEWTLVQLEIIRYLPQSNELMGVAPWLPALYFTAAISATAMGRRLR